MASIEDGKTCSLHMVQLDVGGQFILPSCGVLWIMLNRLNIKHNSQEEARKSALLGAILAWHRGGKNTIKKRCRPIHLKK